MAKKTPKKIYLECWVEEGGAIAVVEIPKGNIPFIKGTRKRDHEPLDINFIPGQYTYRDASGVAKIVSIWAYRWDKTLDEVYVEVIGYLCDEVLDKEPERVSTPPKHQH